MWLWMFLIWFFCVLPQNVLSHEHRRTHSIRSYGTNYPFTSTNKETTKRQLNRALAPPIVHKSTMDELLQKILNGYDKNERPLPANSTQGPVLVTVNIMIRMLSKIDVVNMEYGMQITLREQWLDRRLAYNGYNLTYKPKFLTVPFLASQVWVPDSFFPNEKAGHRHMVDTENMFIRIYPDGTVLYSVRLSLTCSCPMFLSLYPLDVQHCDFDLISYAFTTKDIVYQWDTSGDPVQKKDGVGDDLPNFYLHEHINTSIECTSRTNTGNYACLRMRMRLSRLLNYFLLQFYFPTTIIVVVSWVSFWIDSTSTAGRVALAMTTLLTSFTMQTSINAKLPPVNYVKVIDVWLGTCQTFVFGALIEYAVVCYMESNGKFEHTRNRKSRIAQKQDRLAHLTPANNSSIEDNAKLPCTCQFNQGITSSNSIIATLSLLNPSFAAFFPLTAGLATGSMAGQLQSNELNELGHSAHCSQRVKRSLWQALKHKLRKPDYLPARIDYYARIYAPLTFLVFNAVYWTVCLYKASTWVHPTT